MSETGRDTRFRLTEYVIPVGAALLVLWLIWMAVQVAIQRDRQSPPPPQPRLRLEAPSGATGTQPR